MKVKLHGHATLDFTNREGVHIKGTNLFISYPDDYVTGERVEKVFINDGFALPPAMNPGDYLDIQFNKRDTPPRLSRSGRG